MLKEAPATLLTGLITGRREQCRTGRSISLRGDRRLSTTEHFREPFSAREERQPKEPSVKMTKFYRFSSIEHSPLDGDNILGRGALKFLVERRWHGSLDSTAKANFGYTNQDFTGDSWIYCPDNSPDLHRL
jgi:hypothetical protein